MLECKIMEVLLKTQGLLNEIQLKELRTILWSVFDGCEVIQEKAELSVLNREWDSDLQEYLMSRLWKAYHQQQ